MPADEVIIINPNPPKKTARVAAKKAKTKAKKKKAKAKK